MASIKFIASQARTIFQYKNTRTKVLKWCANIYFNKQGLINKIIPGYDVGSHIVPTLRYWFYFKLAWRWVPEQPKHVATH